MYATLKHTSLSAAAFSLSASTSASTEADTFSDFDVCYNMLYNGTSCDEDSDMSPLKEDVRCCLISIIYTDYSRTMLYSMYRQTSGFTWTFSRYLYILLSLLFPRAKQIALLSLKNWKLPQTAQLEILLLVQISLPLQMRVPQQQTARQHPKRTHHSIRSKRARVLRSLAFRFDTRSSNRLFQGHLAIWGGGYKTLLPDGELRPAALAIVNDMRRIRCEYGIARENENADDTAFFSDSISTKLSNQAPVLVILDEDKQAPIKIAQLYSQFRLFPEDIVAVSGKQLVNSHYCGSRSTRMG